MRAGNAPSPNKGKIQQPIHPGQFLNLRLFVESMIQSMSAVVTATAQIRDKNM